MDCHYKTVRLMLFGLSFLSGFFSIKASAEQQSLVFAIHPYLNATSLIERFTPLIDYLAKKTNTRIEIHVASSYQKHIDAILSGEVDIAFMGPALYLKLMHMNKDIIALGRLGYADRNTFRGAIIVHQDSTMTSLAELANKRFAFGDPNSTLSSLVPKSLLASAGVNLSDLSKFAYLGNHHNVALAVLMGKYDAGGIKDEVYYKYKLRGLKVLQWTPYIPTHIFIAKPQIGKEKVKQLQQILLTIHKETSGLTILNKIKKGVTRIIPAHFSEYAELEDIILPYFTISTEKVVE